MGRPRELSYRRRRRRRVGGLSAGLAIATALAIVVGALSGWDSGRQEPASSKPHERQRADKPTVQPRRPPQFVVASFDGAGTADLWRYWRSVGERTGARFTFFLSGVYLLGEERRTAYLPPQHDPGTSDIGFMQAGENRSSRTHVRALLEQLAAGRREGHEIATHFNGHFCQPYDGSVGDWRATDWRQEIAQFDELLARASALNAIRPPVKLGFGPGDVVGSRTPCLEGDLRVLRRVLREHGFRYDSSSSAPLGTWPRLEQGIWTFPLPEVSLAGEAFRVISMDYNLLVNQNRNPTREQSRGIEEQAYATFLRAFEESYTGNRAPFAIGNHFARWNHSAYVRALTRFLERVCPLPEVRCVPYAELADWLDLRRAQALRRKR